MIFKGKAETLENIEKIITTAKILPQISFSYDEYFNQKKSILKYLEDNKWFEKNLIVRSCGKNEDDIHYSGAGQFTSVGNVYGKENVCNAIQTVFESMGTNKENKVFLQPFINEVDLSGVIFTIEPNTGSHYYVINFDDQTKLTNSVTDGSGKELKTLYFYKGNNQISEKKFQGIIALAKELENLFKNEALDIEFAIKNNELFLFQVRPLVFNIPKVNKEIQDSILKNICNQIIQRNKYNPNILGDFSIYGVMPDWNPAEIIGIHPSTLALSLYEEIITDSVWAHQRSNYGYRNMTSFPLMIDFSGLPYIDARISFNSFVPKDISDELARKILNYYLLKLCKYPEYHDKIEFKIAFTCYSFDLRKRIRELSKYDFSELEISQIIRALHQLTNNIISEKNGLFRNDLLKINTLTEKHNAVMQAEISILEKIHCLLEYCKQYGTLPFAGIARAGFIAMEFLNSLVSINVMTKTEKDLFLSNLKTIGKTISNDSKRLSRNEFMKIYGHLRPGTYDICSPCYSKSKKDYFVFSKEKDEIPSKEPIFIFTKKQCAKIEILLKKHNLNCNFESFISFIKAAIEGREYSKFIFTKTLSEIIELIAIFGEEHGYSREDMSHINIKKVLKMITNTNIDIKDTLSKIINDGKEKERQSLNILLPTLIWNEKQVYEFYHFKNEPNYVTQKECEADIVEIFEEMDIKDKIVIIKNADPGYDWIFSHEIAGLVTAYGGVNSHMAIRCAEFGIPAAIGVGEDRFSRMIKLKRIKIDCKNKRIIEIC